MVQAGLVADQTVKDVSLKFPSLNAEWPNAEVAL